jgi:hypothetical protein
MESPPSSRGLGRQPFKLKTGIRIPLGAPNSLAEPSNTYLSALYDHGHSPSAIRAGEWAAVVHLGWLQGDTFAAAQADYTFRSARTGLVLFFMPG